MKKIFLEVKEACSADWDKMTPQEQGRFCGQCKKIVVDFSQMDDQEIVNEIKNSNRRLCGRFYEDQLMRELDTHVSFAKNPIWRGGWTGIAAGFMLVGSLSLYTAQAQNKLTGEVVVVQSAMGINKVKEQGHIDVLTNDSKVSKDSADSAKVSIKGRVVCAGSDVSMAGTTVSLGNCRTEVDDKGNFQLWVPRSLLGVNQELRAQMLGYKTVVVPLKNGNQMHLDKPIEMEVRPMIMGKITVPKTKHNMERKTN